MDPKGVWPFVLPEHIDVTPLVPFGTQAREMICWTSCAAKRAGPVALPLWTAPTDARVNEIVDNEIIESTIRATSEATAVSTIVKPSWPRSGLKLDMILSREV